MKTFIIFLLLPILACAQTEWGQVDDDSQSDLVAIRKALKSAQVMVSRNFVWIDSSGSKSRWNLHYYSVDRNKVYDIDTLAIKAELADSLCKDITILSLKAQKYFDLLQEAYLELRRLKSDSLADKLRWVEFDKRFRICQ